MIWPLSKEPPHQPMAECEAHRFERQDPYLFYAADLLPDRPVLVEIGSITGEHVRRLREHFRSTVVVYEASPTNYARLSAAIEGTGVVAHQAAVTGEDGEVTFYEFEGRPSSNSILRRRKMDVAGQFTVRSVSVETVLAENDLDRIDVLFSNCEGAELSILDELIAKPALWQRIGQACISFHERIYGQRAVRRRLKAMLPFARIIKDTQSKWPCHLLINWNQLR